MLDYKGVKVKADRKCADCGKIIKKGNYCFTASVKYQGRHWCCNRCMRIMMEEEYYEELALIEEEVTEICYWN